MEMELGAVVVLLLIIAALASLGLKVYKAKKNDGKIDEEEVNDIVTDIRNNALRLAREAQKINELQKQGDEFVKDYIIRELKKYIVSIDYINEEEKLFINEVLLEPTVNFAIKLIIKEKIED